MKPLPQPLRDRLAKLLPRLASPFVGERVATLEAIERSLQNAGCDFHDLTHALAYPAIAHASSGMAAHKPRSPVSECEIDAEELRAIINGIVHANTWRRFLNTKSCDFLDDLRERCDCYATVFLSERQAAWLGNLELAANRAARA
jgi:hypothetical protein